MRLRAVFFGGPCDAQERVADTIRNPIVARMQTGELIRYDLRTRYGDTLIYAHNLTLEQVMDLLVNHYCIGETDA